MARLTLDGITTLNLDRVHLTLEAGECLALWGPSGSGKSKLLRAIADLDPHQGEAWCDDTRRSQLSPPEWHLRVGYLPAESHWWEERVGAHFAAPQRADLDALGMPPDALEWQLERISSGEKQRLALLRLLALRPQVLLLDEPTANLDAVNIQRVETLVERYRRDHQAAVLWVSHDEQQRQRIASRGIHISGRELKEVPWN